MHSIAPDSRTVRPVRARAATAAVAIAVLAWPAVARANEHHFAFVYESATLPAGLAEIEPWVTFRAGRQSHFVEFDNRIEFEGGITDRLQTSLYVNFNGVSSGDGAARSDAMVFQGVSSEWKYRLLDPVADPLGLALYGELEAGPTEAGLELKLIIDKRIGRWLFAANLVLEPEFEFSGTGTEHELRIEADLGAAYFFAPTFSLGLELRDVNNVSDQHGFEWSALYAGPVLAFATHRWWMALSVTPQLPAIYGATPGDVRNLGDHEAIDARVLAGFHL